MISMPTNKMNMMSLVTKKTLAAGTVALMLAGASLAFAQQAPRESREVRGMMRPSAEDVSAFTDARIAALKAGLKLSAEQEKNWPAVETAIRDLAKARADRRAAMMDRMAQRREAMEERMAQRREARRDGRRDGRGGGDADQTQRPAPDAIGRLRQGADAMTTRAAALKKLADASEPLYKTLDDGQKRRFAVLLHAGRMGGHMRGHFQRRADNSR